MNVNYLFREELKIYIESIGFKPINGYYYIFESYMIIFYSDCYAFYNGNKWICDIKFNDLIPLKQFERGYKLKKILG